jgi:hypothetical protein
LLFYEDLLLCLFHLYHKFTVGSPIAGWQKLHVVFGIMLGFQWIKHPDASVSELSKSMVLLQNETIAPVAWIGSKTIPKLMDLTDTELATKLQAALHDDTDATGTITWP